jgi:WD40 repeat protein
MSPVSRYLNETLISGSYDGKLIWRSITVSGETTRTVEAHSRWIRKLAVSPDGQRFASVADDMVCRVWEVESGKMVHEFKGHEPDYAESAFRPCSTRSRFSPNGQHIATADRVGQICIWDANTGSKVQTITSAGLLYVGSEAADPFDRRHSQRCVSHPTARRSSPAASATSATSITSTARRASRYFNPGRRPRSCTSSWAMQKVSSNRSPWGPDGKWFIGVGGDNGGLIQVYDLEAKKVAKSDKAPMHVHACLLNETAEKLFACGHGKVGIWELT